MRTVRRPRSDSLRPSRNVADVLLAIPRHPVQEERAKCRGRPTRGPTIRMPSQHDPPRCTGPSLGSLRSCRRCRSRSRASRGPPTTESSAKGQHPDSPHAWSPKRHAPRREGALDGGGRRQALESQSPCGRELDLHVENGEELQNSLSHRLYAARRVQRHIPVRLRNSGTKRISSAGLRPRTFLKRRRDSTPRARVIRYPLASGSKSLSFSPSSSESHLSTSGGRAILSSRQVTCGK